MASHHPIRKTVSQPAVIPDKLYFRIGDVAKICDVPAYVLRFWETEFPQLKPNKGGTGQRLYRKRDVEMALRIKSLLYDQGYTIPGARQIFKSDLKGADAALTVELAAAAIAAQQALVPEPPPPPAEPEIDMGAVIRQEAQHRDQIASLRDELRALKELLAARATSGPPGEPEPAPASLPAKLTPMRPRLTLEPKPETKPDTRGESRHAPRLVDQGDLFSGE